MQSTKTYPILLVRALYSRSVWRGKYKTRLGPSAEFEKEGFIFAFQDVRGKNMSEGEFVNMRPHIDKRLARMMSTRAVTRTTASNG